MCMLGLVQSWGSIVYLYFEEVFYTTTPTEEMAFGGLRHIICACGILYKFTVRGE